jgi:hypothetical protein
MMKTFSPQLVCLEDRCAPAVFGNPWLDGMHVTLSTAPDGTDVVGQASSLSTYLNALGPSAKLEILRAFQTWVVNANLNVGLVADGGQDFTTGGAIQGDPRFGDIRIGARPLASDVLAITTPFNLFGSYSGNVVLNANNNVNIGGTNGGRDLFTVFLQESGHAFGVGNSPDINSVMYEYYQGVRTSLSAGDVASIQSLYGARTPDQYEGTLGNGTLGTATKLSDIVEADLTTTGDVDVYKFNVPLLTLGTRVKLQASGLSMVTAKLEILNSAGQVVASKLTTDPLNNDLTIDLPGGLLGGTYYARVSSARSDAFGIGSYRLAVGNTTVVDLLLSPVHLLSSELGLNDTLSSATGLLQTTATSGPQIDDFTRASFSTSSDVDYYRVHAPAGSNGSTTTQLVAAVWGLNGSQLDPRLQVYDAAGHAVASHVLTNETGSFVLQVENAMANADYYIRVSSDSGKVGNYAMAVDFRDQAVAFDENSDGTLGGASNSTSADLTVSQSQAFHFVLAGTTAQTNRDAVLRFAVFDNLGNLVFQMQTNDGDAVSADVFLASGSYHVVISAFSKSGGILAPVTYRFGAAGITDPVGVGQADTTSSPDGGGNPGPSGSGTGSTSTASWSGTSSGGDCQWF